MNKSILFGLIIILILTCCFLVKNEGNIEHFWFRRAFRSVRRRAKKTYRRVKSAPRKIVRVVKKSPRAIVRAVKNPKRTLKSAGRGIKKIGKKGLGTLNKIKKLTKQIGSLAKQVRNISKLFSNLKGRVMAAGAVFKSIFGVTRQGFSLLRTAIDMQISAAKMLYLVIDKMYKCNNGFKEVAKKYKEQLDLIMKGLERLKQRAYNCFTFKYGLSKNAYNKCFAAMFSIRTDILNYQKQIDILMKNPRLFAQPRRTKYGQTKAYCYNTRSRAFGYSKSCNQCFNYQGILSRGKDQLLSVSSLMRNSNQLFRELAVLRRNINKAF